MTPSQEIADALLSYTGPEKDLVRNAIVKLAGEDLSVIRQLVMQAKADYRQVLWQATIEDPGVLSTEIAGLTLYQRLRLMNRVQQWQVAVVRHDRAAARTLLRECGYDAVDSEKLITVEFAAAK